MEETYSIFIATDELMTSPVIQGYARMFDIELTLGHPQLISLILPQYHSEVRLERALIHFDSDHVDVLFASVYTHPDTQSAILSLTLEPRDIGVSALSISSNEQDPTTAHNATYTPHFIRNKPIP